VHAEPVLVEAHEHVGLRRDHAELREPPIVGGHRDVGVDLAERVARQEELGEDDEIAALAAALLDDLRGALEVLVDVAEPAGHPGERDPHQRCDWLGRTAAERNGPSTNPWRVAILIASQGD
jgi:hypothetical protein